VIAIHLPPLRERRDDIADPVGRSSWPAIAKERGEQPKALAEDAKGALLAYDWPGNVRELENALERAVVLSKATTIDLAALPDKAHGAPRRAAGGGATARHPTLDVIEPRPTSPGCCRARGATRPARAEVLGIDPSTLYIAS